MRLRGLHLLLTFQCTFECDHCFVWGSPWQRGTMTLATVREALRQARETGSVESVYFEGGEPFLYYAVLLQGVRAAAEAGFKVGIVSNAYWATDERDAAECLSPFRGLLTELSLSSDRYHDDSGVNANVAHALEAAGAMGIPAGVLCAAPPGAESSSGEFAVMYRGRAALELVDRVPRQPWTRFDRCPHEDLLEPERLHLDPLGNLHVCQGIVIGNIFDTPLREICADYAPQDHPVIGPVLDGGPAELARRHAPPETAEFADACHLCYRTREALRSRFPEVLAPGQVYGEIEAGTEPRS